jgi:arsenite-transporting ATPase
VDAPRAQVLLFTGKGGVGKTTVAAATALRCAELGARTLVLSTDPAHSLADALDDPLQAGSPSDPAQVAPGLWAEQLEVGERLDAAWGALREWLVELLDWSGLDAVEAEELVGLPGLDELVALADLVDRADDGRWDTIVVDCAPTAETLRLLTLPDVARWWSSRSARVGGRVTRVIAPVVRSLSGIPLADDRVFSSGARLAARLDGARSLLSDSARTRVRLVVNPERIVVAESLRTATYLSLYGYPLDAVVANRLLPTTVSDPWFDDWRDVQAHQMRAICEAFEPLVVLRGDLQPTEVVGRQALEAFGRHLYAEHDPREAHAATRPLVIERVGAGYELTLDLPFSARGEVDLGRRGDELVLRVGTHRRRIALPDSLRRRVATAAAMRDGRLVVRFEDAPQA